MLASVLGKGGIEEIHQFLPTLKSLAEEDTWWETRAQLLVVCSTVLSYYDDDVNESVLEIIRLIFKPTAHSNIKRIGVAYLAPVLVSAKGDLTPLFVDVVLSLRSNDRNTLLSLQANVGESAEMTRTIELPGSGGSSGLRYQLHSIVGEFSALHVASSLVEKISPNNPFYESHAQILLACIAGAENINNDWEDVWSSVNGSLFNSLANSSSAYLSAQAIVGFCEKNDGILKSVISSNSIGSSLNELYSSSSSQDDGGLCREIFVSDLLEKIASISPSALTHVENLLEGYSKEGGDSSDLLSLLQFLQN